MPKGNVSNEEIKEMNELYLRLKTYAAVAREVGRSPSTVSRYIVKDYVPQEKIEVKVVDKDMIKPIEWVIENWDGSTELTEEERKDLKDLDMEVSL